MLRSVKWYVRTSSSWTRSRFPLFLITLTNKSILLIVIPYRSRHSSYNILTGFMENHCSVLGKGMYWTQFYAHAPICRSHIVSSVKLIFILINMLCFSYVIWWTEKDELVLVLMEWWRGFWLVFHIPVFHFVMHNLYYSLHSSFSPIDISFHSLSYFSYHIILLPIK